MIEVKIEKDGVLIGHIELNRFHDGPQVSQEDEGDFDSYRVVYRVWRGAQAAHRRVIYGFPRRYYNVFALVLQALNALNEKDLKLERDYNPDEAPVSADMAGGLDPTVREIPSRQRKRDHH